MSRRPRDFNDAHPPPRAAPRRLARCAAGAAVGVIATNTMHLLFDRLAAASPIPLLSIVDATARAVTAAGLSKVGLLGTRFTMEQSFYADGLARHGIATLVPDPAEREDVHRVIMQELSMGTLREASRRRYVEIIEALAARGAHGVVLGCTEIPLLVQQAHVAVPLFDTATLHAEAALAYISMYGIGGTMPLSRA